MSRAQTARQFIQAVKNGKGDPIATGNAIEALQTQVDVLQQSVTTVAVSAAAASGSAETPILPPTNLVATAVTTATDGVLVVTITGTLPIDANMAGFRFIVERPAPGDVDAEHLTLPGVLLNDVPVLYTKGDGGSFSQSFEISKPNGLERDLIYVLPFAEGYENPFIRLTQQSPPLPANVTAYAVLNIGASQTVAGSELTDITLTGTTILTPTGIGTLKVSKQYVPPYLAGPTIAIGDFQGVTVWYIDQGGVVSNLGDQPYRPPVAFDATPPGNLGTLNASIPMPPSGSTVHFVVCSYSTTKHLPFREFTVAPSAIVLTVAVDDTTVNSGLATQVSGFGVTVSTPVIAGGDTSGVRTQHYIYTFTPPVDAKWKSVNIWRGAATGPPGWTLVSGGVQGTVAGGLTVSPGFSGDFSMPSAPEYWIFEARSVNEKGQENTISAPRVFVTLTPSGELVNAANSITASMLQDLAVEARSLADYAVQTRNYAPLSIVSAAIGIAAINDANIANLNVNKLTGNTMSLSGLLTIAATGGININDGAGSGISIGAALGAGVWISSNALHGSVIAGNGESISTNNLNPSSGRAISVGGQLSFSSSYYAGLTIAGMLPAYSGHAGQFLKTDGSGLLWDTPAGGGAVDSVFGRTGAVVAATGDYTASQVGAAPAIHSQRHKTGGVDQLTPYDIGAAAGNHNHNTVYAPLNYSAGQTVNAQLLYLTNDLDAGLDVTVDPTTLTSMTFTNGRLTAYA